MARKIGRAKIRNIWNTPPSLREMRIRTNPKVGSFEVEIRRGSKVLKKATRNVYSEFNDGTGRRIIRNENVNYELHKNENIYFIDINEVLA